MCSRLYAQAEHVRKRTPWEVHAASQRHIYNTRVLRARRSRCGLRLRRELHAANVFGGRAAPRESGSRFAHSVCRYHSPYPISQPPLSLERFAATRSSWNGGCNFIAKQLWADTDRPCVVRCPPRVRVARRWRYEDDSVWMSCLQP